MHSTPYRLSSCPELLSAFICGSIFSVAAAMGGVRKPWWRSQAAQAVVQVEQGWSLGRTPKSWAAVA